MITTLGFVARSASAMRKPENHSPSTRCQRFANTNPPSAALFYRKLRSAI